MTAQLTFDDEFNSLSLWNGSSSGTWDSVYYYDDAKNGSTLAGNAELEMYINSNWGPTSSVKPWTVDSSGVLHLTAAPASPEISAQINGMKYTSGMINTYHSHSQTYGYFEMSAQLPAGQGLWPAFWLLPEDGSWPPELDIMEVLGNDTTHLYTTAHSQASGEHTYSTQNNTVTDMSQGFHKYAVDWQADKITFYFDGKQVFQTDTPADMHKPMYMLANLAVGGGWPGSPDSTTPFPADYQIDYIRAWDSNPYTNGGTIPDGGSTGAAPVAPNTVVGTAAADTLTGDATLANHIRGGDGADLIVGGSGFNNINGNAGADSISAKSTVGDWLLGGQGNDQINSTASTGHNIINGNLGSDTLTGGSGGDSLRGGQGDDVIRAGNGNNWISGDLGNNHITGGTGMDTFHAGQGYDSITGWHAGDHVQLDAGVTMTSIANSNADVHIVFSNGGQMDLLNTQVDQLQSGWLV